MDTIKDIVYALVNGISENHQMSLLRIVKLVYLFDWSCVLNFGCLASRFQWSCGMCGPSCEQILQSIANSTETYRTFAKDNRQGGEKVMVECIDYNYTPHLSEPCEKAVSHVVRATRGNSWNDLVRLVSSTMPVVISSLDEPLDLARAAVIRRKMLGKG